MAPKRRPAAASAAPGSASDGEADSSHDHRSPSPCPSRSRSRTKTPPPNTHPNAAALSSTPISAAVDLAAASDSDADGDAEGRLPSPRRSRERSPRPHSDSDISAAAASDEDNATPPRRYSLVDPHKIKPISSSPRRPSQRSKRPRSSPLSAERRKRPPRVWSPKDEITILRSLISYRSKKGALPASTQETGKLHSQIRGQLTAEASTTQLCDKVRRLKHKFRLLVARTKDGQDPELPTVHECDVYELSKMVWGADAAGRAAYGNYWFGDSDEEQKSGESDEEQGMDGGWEGPDRRANRRLKAITVSNGTASTIAMGHCNRGGKGNGMYPYLWEAVQELSEEQPSGTAFRKAFDVLEGSRALAMEERLEKFKLSEIRQHLRRMDLMKETVKMVLDALEGAN
ncbi:uncharacterized protein [Lolium perenne]|uniref:uncharacterized protein n=1 Tax=Lolium perenne TaxID=4522 RepID=UPI003A99F365